MSNQNPTQSRTTNAATRGKAGRKSRSFVKNEDGGVVLWVGLFFGMLGVGAVLIDLSMLYVAKQRAQIVSDAAVVAAAATPDSIVGQQASPQAIATANNIAEVNGYSLLNVKTVAAASPRGDGSLALQTVITDDVKLGFGIFSPNGRGSVGVNSWASAGNNNPAGLCSGSLYGPVNIYGNAVVDAPNCVVRAATYFYSCGKANISLAKVQVGYKAAPEAAYLCSTASLQSSQGLDYSVAPPSPVLNNQFESDPRLVELKTTLKGMAPVPTSTVKPVPPASSTDAKYTSQTDTLAKGNYRNLTMTSSNLTLQGSGGPDPSCKSPTTFSGSWTFTGNNTLTVNSGCYVIGASFTANAGSNVAINVEPGASVVFVYAGGSFYDSGNVSFGDATHIFNGGSLTVYKGASLSFGNGPFYFYGGTIYNYATLTYGNGPFYFFGGSWALDPNSTTTFGIGDVWFYGGSWGSAFNGSLTFGNGGDPANANGTIYMYGGSFSMTGSMTARGVTFALLGGTLSIYNSGTINITAPTGTSVAPESNGTSPAMVSQNYQDVLFALWGGAFNLYQTKAPTATMAGLVYNPQGNVSIYHDQIIALPATDKSCFQVLANVLDIYENANVQMAPCKSFAGADAIAKAGTLVQ